MSRRLERSRAGPPRHGLGAAEVGVREPHLLVDKRAFSLGHGLFKIQIVAPVITIQPLK